MTLLWTILYIIYLTLNGPSYITENYVIKAMPVQHTPCYDRVWKTNFLENSIHTFSTGNVTSVIKRK